MPMHVLPQSFGGVPAGIAEPIKHTPILNVLTTTPPGPSRGTAFEIAHTQGECSSISILLLISSFY
jgi:hypothetical protein